MSDLIDMELTRQEASAVAEFIDIHIFPAIREDTDWDSFQNLRNFCPNCGARMEVKDETD